jgi:acetyltransferase-like isoleucine patch superfamily enzyme
MGNRIKHIYYYLVLHFYNRYKMIACGKGGVILKPLLITYKYLKLKNKVFVRDNARIEGVSTYQGDVFNPVISIGNGVSIEQNFHLTCAKSIIIGNNTAIASNVSITDINHPYENIALPPERQNITTNEVIIGNDCKIYNNVVILPGTVLGKHNIVGANSVVLGKSYPDYSIIVGAPAKIVKRYSFEKCEWLKTNGQGDFISK